MKRILIVGGGAGGLELASRLGNKLGKPGRAEIFLVDRELFHVWKPLLHEVATGTLDTGVAAVNFRTHARSNHFNFRLGAIKGIDRDRKEIVLQAMTDEKGGPVLPERRLSYDILVMAIGSVTNDFGTKGIANNCIFLDRVDEAERFHRELLDAFLRRRYHGTDRGKVGIAIVGGGATGVELSAELYNVVDTLHEYDILDISREQLQITLVEAGPKLLPALPDRISKAAEKELLALGVDIKTETLVRGADERGLLISDGERIDADIMVWAAGVKAPDFLQGIGGLETNNKNQLVVNAGLQTTLDDAIYAIGDCAGCRQEDGTIVPPRAQAAHQMASHVYRNILLRLNNRAQRPYRYTDHGSLVTLSRYSTIGSLMGNLTGGTLFIEGMIARFMYRSLYRFHQIAVHGWFRTLLIVIVDRINMAIRPRLKLH